MNSKTELALPLRAESATPPLDLHFIMEHGHERYAAAFCSERSKADAIVSACNTHTALQSRCEALRAGLRDLARAYLLLLENGRDRIVSLGGQCDSLEIMERGDPYLRQARALLEQRT